MMGGMTLLRRGNAFCAIGFGAQIVPFFAELSRCLSWARSWCARGLRW